MTVTEQEPGELTVEAVLRQLPLTPRTLRYYEEVGLIAPSSRTSGGHRLYDQKTVERLQQILRLKENLGVSLQEIREILDAEQALDALRQSFHQNRQDHERQLEYTDRYIEVLRQLIEKMDEKIESVTAMRDRYQERLQKSLYFRENGFRKNETEGE
ncbi:hypothetical protein AYW79_09120 [Ferroacidibacillus organovorans]|uniref:HTH merR-type domain-containing protein n=1 Tax=Ferroacidibacillus organovorans TaxID=1765683 RepID=A0A162UI97_9BACL|nr:hypothetical protein AYJ22_05965 [Ferroacidibacillus organovorans]OAG93727.1 hypothetical protein AYW79_09120 [Ferroacidibacillus organovorans]OPG16080.1 hypothetical protein B2M26_08520 [Ferroacidibacillus organovorans]